MRRNALRHIFVAALAGFCLNANATSGGAAVFFRDSSKVNLCLARGARATASANCISDPNAALRPVHGSEIRFQSNYGAAWWMVEWPRTFKASRLRLQCRNVITSLGFQVKISDAALTENGWKSLQPVAEWRAAIKQPGGIAEVSWKPVAARFLRVEFLGHNGAESGEAGQYHADLVSSRVQVYGADKLAITPQISMLQSAWSHSRVQLWQGNDAQDASQLVDDSLESNFGFNDDLNYNANPSIPTETAAGKPPARIEATLPYRSLLEAVAFSSVAPDRSESPRDLKIYTSLDEIGDRWTLQKTFTDIKPNSSGYQEIAFAKPVRAHRVRFEIERVATQSSDATTRGILSELYAYGTPEAPDFSFSLPRAARTTAVIFDLQGNRVRTLWQLRTQAAGAQSSQWDGLTDFATEAPQGEYELRVYSNPGRYENVAAIGNTGPPGADGHVPTTIEALAVDDEGAVYSANNWDEAGHDWKKWDKNGNALMHSNYQVRNGNPNGLPYQIAVDAQWFYVAYFSHTEGGSQWIQRFNRKTGISTKWDKAAETA
jgi:hypothetical protein